MELQGMGRLDEPRCVRWFGPRQPAASLPPFLTGLNAGVWRCWTGGSWGWRRGCHKAPRRVTSLSLDFLIWKMGIMTPSTPDYEVH